MVRTITYQIFQIFWKETEVAGTIQVIHAQSHRPLPYLVKISI